MRSFGTVPKPPKELAAFRTSVWAERLALSEDSRQTRYTDRQRVPDIITSSCKGDSQAAWRFHDGAAREQVSQHRCISLVQCAVYLILVRCCHLSTPSSDERPNPNVKPNPIAIRDCF
jgi:hypothetical protein